MMGGLRSRSLGFLAKDLPPCEAGKALRLVPDTPIAAERRASRSAYYPGGVLRSPSVGTSLSHRRPHPKPRGWRKPSAVRRSRAPAGWTISPPLANPPAPSTSGTQNARTAARTLLRGNPRPLPAHGRRGPARRPSPTRWSMRVCVYEGAKAFVDAAPPRADRHRHPRPLARHPRRKEGPARRRPAAGHRRLPQVGRPHLDRSGQDRDRPQEGRVLRRPHRQEGRRRRRRSSPASCRKIITSFPWAKSMQLGQWRPQLGAPAPRHHRHLRHRERRARWSSPSPPTTSPPARPPTATASSRPPPSRCAASTTTCSALEKAKVVLDLDRRKDIIRADADNLAFAQGLTVIDDEGLLEEVAGLVEWPVVDDGLVRSRLPHGPRGSDHRHHPRQPEMLLPARRLRQAAPTNSSSPPTPSPPIGGATIVAGNERVIRARLSRCEVLLRAGPEAAARARPAQARRDGVPRQARHPVPARRAPGEARRRDRPLVGADVEHAKRAAMLAKADLITGMVGEFPELQGIMGRYYALAQGETAAVANAIADHYKPLGPTDRVPTEPVVDRRRARRQARPPHRLLGHRRKAHRLARSRSRCAARRWA